MPGPHEEREPSSSRNILVFGFTSLFNDTASEMAYWVLPAFLASIGAGPAQLGIIEGIAESVASFVQLFSGYLADRIPRRKPIVVAGYFVANLVKPLLALVTSWWQVLAIRFADRFSKGMRSAPRDVMVAESSSELGSAYGLIQAMDSAGAVLGPLAALWLLRFYGLRGVFWAAAAPGFLCFAIALFGIKEVRKARSAAGAPKAHAVVVDSRAKPRELSSSAATFVLPPAFYYVLFAVTLFSLGNSSDMFLVLRAQSIGIPAVHAPLLGLGVQYYLHFVFLAGRASQRSRFPARHRRRWISGICRCLFCVWAGSITIGDLACHGFLRIVLCPDQSRAQGPGGGDGGEGCPRPRFGRLRFYHQRRYAAGQPYDGRAVEALRPASSVLPFGSHRRSIVGAAARLALGDARSS